MSGYAAWIETNEEMMRTDGRPINANQNTHGGSPRRLAALSLALAGSLWGTGFFFGKMAFQEMSVTENVTFRLLIGSVALLPILIRTWQPFRGRDLWILLLSSVVGVPVQFLIQFKGLEMTTVSHASLVIATLPMLLAGGSAIFLRERLGMVEWGVLVLSAFGAVLIAISNTRPDRGPHPTLNGDLLVLLSAVAGVVMTLSTKNLVKDRDSSNVTAATLLVGTGFLLFYAELWQPLRFHFSPKIWAAVGAQGIFATAGAYLLWNWGLAKMPASRSGVFLNLEPVVGTCLGIIILHETLGLTAVIGGMIIIASAIFFSLRPGDS
jgi:drug/metabolite transporter (DMT)-like permease